MPSSRITVDGTGQVYSELYSPLAPYGRESETRVKFPLLISIVSVGSSGGIFRGLGASAHTISDSLGALAALTLLLQRLYSVEYITSDKTNQHFF